VRIRVGYELSYEVPQPTPMLLALHVHPSRAPDLMTADDLVSDPVVAVSSYEDSFGNRISRIVAPLGRIRLSGEAIVRDSGRPDPVFPHAMQHEVQDLPQEALMFLLGSRYCETDRLSDIAWRQFGGAPFGWGRVQAICDFVHRHVTFGYAYASPAKTAWDTYQQGAGVCRDFTHLSIALCRCMNIPARYCTGYLGDIGVPPMDAPMDFSAWFEVYLDGAWHVFDARFNTPRIGRVLMARGRDAADVAIATTFGPNALTNFKVFTDELVSG
jgi:transglutaminase-like putative cysteine protease